MQLLALLGSKRTEIVERWVELALAVYPQGAAGFIGREKDRFRNPVGHVTGESLQTLFDVLVQGKATDQMAEPLDAIVRVRAIQELSPTQAVGFVFQFKRAVREALGRNATDTAASRELTELDSRVDRLALAAFDRFVMCREAIYDLRAREAKRRTWSLIKRLEKTAGKEPGREPVDATGHQPKGGDGA